MQALRAKQIGSLFQYNPGVREIARDSQYEVAFVSGGRPIQLRIVLPSGFPQQGPNVYVTPAVVHPWVNEQMAVTGCARLQSWRMHSDLGQAIQDIVRQFEQYPPSFSTFAPNQPYQPPASSGGGGHAPRPSWQPAAASVDVIPLPEQFPELEQLSFADLQQLNENKTKLVEFVGGLEFLKTLSAKEAELREDTEKLARANLEREPTLTEARERLQQKHQVLREKRSEFDDLVAQQQELSKRFAPQSILDSLRIAAHTAEEEAEGIVHDFHAGKMTVDKFVEAFVAKKTLHHLRKAKEEQLARSMQLH
eukprot:m.43740 g.43740  ORF g.43740 m.43740 type:complete len:308 (+) comp11654_c0_seq3:395-1318(+)